MRIGALSAASGVDVETIRYYEKSRLLDAPPRRANGYREYGPSDLKRLALIRHCRSLDISLVDVRKLLDLVDDPGCRCGEADALVERQIARVQERIVALRALESELVALRAQCAAPATSAECRILGTLAQPVTAQ